MHITQRNFRFFALIVTLACALLLAAPTRVPHALAQQMPYVGQTDPGALAEFNYRFIVVKFEEGSDVRMRSDALVALDSSTDMSGLYSALNAESDVILDVGRLFARSEAEIAADRLAAEVGALEPMPDLNLYHYIRLTPEATAADAAALINRLNALDVVQTAYAEPYYMETQVDVPPTTPNFTQFQGYRDPAPLGIDIMAAWYYPSGRGSNVRVIDLERGWILGHEDLNLQSSDILNNYNIVGLGDHGLSVMGILLAYRNNYGITGLIPDATGRMVSIDSDGGSPSNMANAINLASANAQPGDLILYEVAPMGPDSGDGPNDGNCPAACGNCGQWEQVPAEFYQANFDATRVATASGRIVVQAAANGGMNLNHSRYDVNWNGSTTTAAPGGAFNRFYRDSGAILVGATNPTTHAPMCWTNHGSRVDLNGWGSSVYTLGDGDLWMGSNQAQQAYTHTFGGTSSATPIVAGAVGALRSISEARGTPWTGTTIRNTLYNTGTPQTNLNAGHVGPRPNLAAALAQLIAAPSNDLFANAVNIAALPYTDTRNIDGSTNTSGDPFPCTAQRTNTVWYRHTAAQSGWINVNTFGSGYSTFVAVLTGSPGSWTSIACNTGVGGTNRASVTFQATAGTTYQIMVAKTGEHPTLSATSLVLNMLRVVPPDTNLISNGTFDSTADGWVFGGLTHQVVNGVLEVTQNSGANSPNFYRFIDQGVPQNATLELTLQLGNSSPVAKTVNMQLRALNWSGFTSCVFTMPAYAPMQNYTMRIRTGTTWSPFIVQGWLQGQDTTAALRIDNVSVHYKPGVWGPDQPFCRAEPPLNTNLLFDGGFDYGLAAYAPWNATAQVLPINGNPALHIARNPSTPDGGFYQWNPYTSPGGTVFEFNFRMGNSSNVAKTVHLLFRSPDWTQMRSCWVTVPANTPLMPRIIRFYGVGLHVVFQAWLINPDGQLGLTFDDFDLRWRPDLNFGQNVECLMSPAQQSAAALETVEPALVGEGGIAPMPAAAPLAPTVALPNGDLSVVVPVDPSQMGEGGIVSAPPESTAPVAEAAKPE